jgi:hypothetical protein
LALPLRRILIARVSGLVVQWAPTIRQVMLGYAQIERLIIGEIGEICGYFLTYNGGF